VHLFELSVPAIESLGWTLQEVAQRSGQYLGPRYAEHEPWFCFPSPAAPKGTWFDATLQRTERYGLFSVPHLRNRLRRLYVFDSVAELGRVVAPFVADMASRHAAHPDGQGALSAVRHVGTEGSLTARLLNGELVDADLRGVTSAAEARQRIAEHLGVRAEQVRLLKESVELDDEARVEAEELGVVMGEGCLYDGKPVTKIVPPGVTLDGGYSREWTIEHGDLSRTCTAEETARTLIQKFNFKKCTQTVEFFWHGHSAPQSCEYYIPQS